MGTAKEIMINETDLINEADLDAVISELRVGLDQIDQAILIFERLASKKKPDGANPPKSGSSPAQSPGN